MPKIIQGLEDAIFANLSEAYVYGDLKSSKIAVHLLECYSNRLLLGIHEVGDFAVVILSRLPLTFGTIMYQILVLR